MQIWIHDNKMRKIVALNNDIPDMLSYTNSTWHSYLDQATSTFDFTIPKFSNGKLHEDLKLINDECFVSFYVNGSYQVFYIATLQEDDFNIQLTCNNTNLEYALEYANPFSSESAQTIEWYLNHMELLAFAAVEIGNNEIPDRKRTLTFDSQETKMNRLQSLMSKFEAEFEFKVELNRDGTYKRIVINIYQKNHIGTDRKDVILYYSNGLKGVQVSSDKTQMFNAGVFTGKDGLNLADVEFSEKNSDGVEEFYSRKGSLYTYAPLSRERYPSTMQPGSADNWIRKDFTTEYENVNDLKAYALRTLKQYAYPLVTYTASVQSGFVSHYTDLKLGDTIRIIDKNFVGGLALEARVSEMIICFDNPANNSFVFTNYRKLDNKPSSALQTRIEQVIESRLSYRIELATTSGVTFKNNEGETIIKPSLYKGNLPWTKDVTWHWTLNGVVTDGMQYRIQARDIIDTAVLTVDAFVDGKKVATTEITLTNVNDGLQGPQGPQGDEGPQGPQGDEGPKGDKGDTGNGIANTVVTYGLSMSDTTEPATWSSSVPTLVKGMYLWTRTVIIYTNGESTTSYQISYIAKDADATAAIDKTKQELLEKLETVRDDSLAAAEEAKQQITTVADELSTAKQDFQNAVSTVDTKATNLKSELTQTKQDLTSQAQQLQAQANAQSELTKRVSTVEKTADGTKTTVNELTKTVAQNGKDITSVTARTKTVEDDLAGTKTTLSQVKTTADSASQKTATLETGLNGLSAKFDSLKIGGANLLLYSADPSKAPSGYYDSNGTQRTSETYNGSVVYKTQGIWNGIRVNLGNLVDRGLLKVGDVLTYSVAIRAEQKTPIQARLFIRYTNQSEADSPTNKIEAINLTADWQYVSVTFTVTAKMLAANTKVTYLGWELTSNAETDKYVYYACNKIERGNVATDYSPSDADIEQKVAEYKQNADQNYASLQTTVQTLDGQVQSNKTTAEQTAQGFKTRIESLETYKNGESERANAYFESAKTETAKQITAERTAIADNYVAKSTYTSDVTGIRNELSATTSTANVTKTNLANYQASNDRAVANLQSNLQEANGNISSLQTKVEAVPGQITSAVSSVEGKIPKSVGGRNLALGTSADWSAGLTSFNGQNNQARSIYRIYNRGFKIGDRINIRLVLKYSDIVATEGQRARVSAQFRGNVTDWGAGQLAGGDFWFDKSDGEIEIKSTTVVSEYTLKNEYWEWRLRVDYVKSGKIQWKEAKAEVGDLPTPWSPAPEDTAEQISNLSSEIKQTADGMTLLATKTELNSAKTELQSGINAATNKANSNAQTISTHTTQISALNTGLQAKVSQTDFNALSGRVTTAENNITAKANELSSKISSVEGKIPTEIGSVNLFKGSRDFSGTDWIGGAGEYAEEYKGVKIFKKQDIWGGRSQYFEVKTGEEYVFSAYVKSSVKTDAVNFYLPHDSKQPKAEGVVSFCSTNSTNNVNIGLTDKYKRIAIKIKITKDGWMAPRIERYNSDAYLFFGGYKLERGNIATDWTPAPDDAVVGGRNYALKTGDSKSSNAGGKLYDLSSAFDGIADDATLIIEFDWRVTAPTSTSKFRINRVITYSDGTAEQWNDTIVTDGVYTDVSSSRGSGHYSGTFTKVPYDGKTVSSRYLYLTQSTASGTVTISNLSVRVGSLKSDWQPAPEDYDSKLASAQSEIKQTTDAIKASVSSLDNSTVKSSSLTINSDGIVMKAGKSTTDVANAIGSYFAVNQNAINLFSDKINVKGNMIVAGAITADKIAANSISSDKIVSSGITADVISGGVLKAANDAMQVNLNSSNITFSKDASVIFTSSDNALKRVIPGKPSQFIKMCDSVFVSEIGELPDSTITVIASNSDRTENIDSVGFGGMKIWNGSSSTDSTSFVELVGNRVAIYGNKNRSPWLFDMTTTTSSLIPQNSNGIKHSLGRSDRPFHSVYADNMYIQGERVAMMLKDIALYIGYKGNNGWVDRIS